MSTKNVKDEKKLQNLQEIFCYETFIQNELNPYLIKDLNSIIYQYVISATEKDLIIRLVNSMRNLDVLYVPSMDLCRTFNNKPIYIIKLLYSLETDELMNNIKFFLHPCDNCSKKFVYCYNSKKLQEDYCLTCTFYCPCLQKDYTNVRELKRCQLCCKQLCIRHDYIEFSTYPKETSLICKYCISDFQSFRLFLSHKKNSF